MSEELDSSQIRFGSKVGRFVVDGELGAGGMGVVYAAHDRELDRHVALKVLRGAIDEESRNRLLREGQAMARVTHPNVITVYECGIEGRMVFLAQELLDGGSLRQWLEKPRSQQEIVDKFVAAGRGLAAAHGVGLVHRDFKPDNVLLGKDGRVRVSDFGLARSLGTLETMPAASHIDALARTTNDIMRSPMATMTRTGAVMGTPLYMSPEQHRGEAADERSDQFSFCVALYEAMYGAVPFPGKTAVALADNVIAGRIQPPPRGAKVSARLRRILLRGLATDPRARYGSMDALIADLLHDPARKVRRFAIYALIGVLLSVGVVGGYVMASRRNRGSLPAQRTIAVLGFKNLSNDKTIDWISSGLSELLAPELEKGDNVQVVPAEAVTRARTELALPSVESYTDETLQRITTRLGANAVVTGSYIVGNDITLVVTVADVHRHKNSRLELHGQPGDLRALAAQAGTQIREALGITSLAIAKRGFDALPKNPDAQRAFMEGTTALRAFDFARAKDRLLEAAKREPDFAPTFINLASAYEGLSDRKSADQMARRALDVANAMPDSDQKRLVSAQAYEHLGQPDRARELYRPLFELNRKLEYGLALLRVETSDNFAATLGAVRKLGDDPRIDLAEARAEVDKGNTQRALELVDKAGKSADPIIKADAKLLEGNARTAAGELTKAVEAYDASFKLYDGVLDRPHMLDVMELFAAVNVERGELDDAIRTYEAIASVRGANEQGAAANAAIAYALALRGRLNDADQRLRDAETHKGDDPVAIPWVDLASAAIKWARGDLQGAIKASENCASRFTSSDLAMLCLEMTGEIHADLGDFAGARKIYEEVQKSAKTPQRAGAVQALLGQLDFDESGGADEKAKAVIEAVKPVQASAAERGAKSLEVLASIVLARAHLARAASQEALTDVEDKTPPQPIRLRVRALVAHGLAAYNQSDPQTSSENIDAALNDATKQGYVELALEARLARVEMSPPEERKAELDAIVRDAKQRGFGRIVKLAETLAQPAPP